MQTTFRLFVSCLLCLALPLFIGCGGGNGAATQEPPTLTVLHGEILFGNLENVKDLVNRGADVNAKDDIGNTALHYVEVVEIAQFLVSRGADVHARNDNGDTPLDRAKLMGNTEVAAYLESL